MKCCDCGAPIKKPRARRCRDCAYRALEGWIPTEQTRRKMSEAAKRRYADRPRKYCADCACEIDKRAKRCSPCSQAAISRYWAEQREKRRA